ncbi:MAG: YdgA family protein [Verrucomicrobiales bacterium]|nr:YdgA family protein [Verrucomicrobiales bacterium]
MKRSLLLIPLILLALWAGTTWIIGSYTQSGFDIALEKVNQQLAATPAQTSISQDSYSRGFLSSQAITKISHASKAESEENDVFLKFQAWHGPLMFTPKGLKFGNQYVIVTLAKDQLPEKICEKIEAGFKGKEAFEIAIFSGFDGQVDVEASISPFSSDEKSNTTLQFEGLTGQISTDHQGSFAKGSLKFGALTFADKKSGDTLSIAALIACRNPGVPPSSLASMSVI